MAFFKVHDPEFYDAGKLDTELRRVFDVCHSCRLCWNLCPSFPHLFDLIDATPSGELEQVASPDFRRVVDLCFNCKLCYVKCPYTPPHKFDIDFPRLMLRAKMARAKDEGVTVQDRVLGDPDTMGKIASRLAPLANAANRSRVGRVLLEKTAGIHRDRILPVYHGDTFERRFARRSRAPLSEPTGKVSLFYTCSLNYNSPDVAMHAVEVLEHNRIDVGVPPQQCCGMPKLDGGDVEGTLALARANVETLLREIDQGRDIVVPGPTCSYMIRMEYPDLLDDAASKKVAAHTYDLCQYLWKLSQAGALNTSFEQAPASVAYHFACHLKAQNLGLRSRDMLRLTGAEVTLLDRCTGMDGTWGMKTEFFEASLKVAKPLFDDLAAAQPEVVATDCPLAGIQITQGTRIVPMHPISILHAAYGLSPAPWRKAHEEARAE